MFEFFMACDGFPRRHDPAGGKFCELLCAFAGVFICEQRKWTDLALARISSVANRKITPDKLQSTMGNNVDECVLRVIRQLKFPSPRGGGVVSVSYPFVFTAR